jgi:NAD(P)-dependent dehydrogenase (short-subunit alcohol dehydrogenase family)
MAQRVALVTGGLTGIGLASARVLQAQGHRVAVCSRRGGADPVVQSVREQLGADALIGRMDVADQTSVDAFVAKVRTTFGPPQILVNAAGVYHENFLDGDEDAGWYDQIDINLNGCYRTIRACFGGMKQGGWGRIVNIASTAGSKGAAGYSGYCASKAGVIGLSKALAVEGAPFGVNCMSISPTWVETPMMDAATRRQAKAAATTPEAAKAALLGSNPQNRLVQPSEIAALVALFTSDNAPGLTNVDVQINAGADW